MTQQTKIILGASAAVVVLMLATNPDQASHLRAIQETFELLKPKQPYSASPILVANYMTMITYNNYFVFSTSTLLDGVVTWGTFGKVCTTNRISKPF